MVDLIFFPGTLTDKRLLTRQKEAFPQLQVPEWLPPLKRNESLASYSKRMADTLSPKGKFYLGGVSLGGMMAQEIARHMKPEGVIMVATAPTGKALPLLFRIFGTITRYTPRFLLRLWLRLNGFLIRHLPVLSEAERQLYGDMVKEMPPALVQWQSAAPNSWKLQEPLSMPTYHIHGDKDPLIPLKNVKPNKVVKNGGHLINVMHSTEVNDFIGQIIKK